jgi:hypothetical protein
MADLREITFSDLPHESAKKMIDNRLEHVSIIPNNYKKNFFEKDVRRSGDRHVRQTGDCNNGIHICGTQEGRSPKWRPSRAPN